MFKNINNYGRFVNENLQKANSIINNKIKSFNELKDILSNNNGYIGQFTNYLFNNNVSIDDIKSTYNDLIELKSKNKNIDVYKYDTYEELSDVIIKYKNDISVNTFINQFPSVQKNIVKNLIADDNNYNIVLKVSKKENIKAFISKISRYKDDKSLKNALKLYAKDTENTKDIIISKLDNMESTLLINDKNILIVKVESFEDLLSLASDTSWCILNKSTYNDYTSNGKKQFILFDYNKGEFDIDFKIGFTINNQGKYYTAHNILDNYVNEHNLNDLLAKVNTTMPLLLRDNKKMDINEVENSINNIRKNTRLRDINLIVDLIKYNIDLNVKLLNKLINIFEINKNNNYVSNLSNFKKDIIKDIIKNIFISKDIVTEKDLINVNKDLPYIYDSFGKSKILTTYQNPYTMDSIWIYGKSYVDKTINSYINSNDIAILKELKYGYVYLIESLSYKLYNEDYEYLTKEDLNLIINRLLKSDNNNILSFAILLYLTINSVDYRNNIKNYKEIISNIILKDYNILCKLWKIFKNNNDFKYDLDLSNSSIKKDLYLTEENIYLIKKKDYNTPIYYLDDSSRSKNIINLITNHLNNYKITFTIDFNNDGMSFDTKGIENTNLIKILNRIISPGYSKKSYEQEGNITVIIK